MNILLAICVVVAWLATVHAAPEANGGWAPLPTTKNISVFDDTNYSFDVRVNWAICNRFVMDIPLRAHIVDYAPVLSAALRVLNLLGGGSVRLQRGVYPISGNVYIPSNTCILGKGVDNTVLRVNNHIKPIYPHAGHLRSRRESRISLHGFTVDGNKLNQRLSTAREKYGRYGLYFELVNYVWLKNIKMKNNVGYGCMYARTVVTPFAHTQLYPLF